jgi:predicted ATPase
MKLESLYIEEFKNLRNFSVTFDTDSLTSVILGRNGTGKSNLLEALILIFRDLDLREPPPFAYRMVYFWHEYEVSIDADPARSRREQVQVKLDGWEVTYQEFRNYPDRRFLPKYVFGYYSGPSNRMESHFEKHQQLFYRDLLRGADNPLRPLLYARLVHSQFALLSFFNEEDEAILKFLKETLGIEELVSVLFVLREPSWTSRDGDPRFWNARGVVQHFLGELYRLALMPLRLKQRITPEFQSTKTLEHLYLYLKDAASLKELASHYQSQQEFFKALESTYISKILSEVRIRIKIRKADGSLTFRDLSEGEQQLLMVLGLLRFTKEDEALFLLDEPDTHLNPAWSIQYLEFLRMVVGDQPTSQIIMSTHNPLVVASLERRQVLIMERDEQTGHITMEHPYEDPQGMGVAAILTSDLFELRSTLDPKTQRDMDRRRELAVKQRWSQQGLTQEEWTEFSELNQQLEGLDFSITMQDPLYHDFVLEMTRRENPAIRGSITLTKEQREQQRELTRQILRELTVKEHQE